MPADALALYVTRLSAAMILICGGKAGSFLPRGQNWISWSIGMTSSLSYEMFILFFNAACKKPLNSVARNFSFSQPMERLHCSICYCSLWHHSVATIASVMSQRDTHWGSLSNQKVALLVPRSSNNLHDEDWIKFGQNYYTNTLNSACVIKVGTKVVVFDKEPLSADVNCTRGCASAIEYHQPWLVLAKDPKGMDSDQWIPPRGFYWEALAQAGFSQHLKCGIHWSESSPSRSFALIPLPVTRWAKTGRVCDVDFPQSRMVATTSWPLVGDIRDTVNPPRGFDQSAILISYRVWDCQIPQHLMFSLSNRTNNQYHSCLCPGDSTRFSMDKSSMF